MSVRFKNRSDAGRQLAAALSGYRQVPDVLVLALPRGGVPVAFEVAQAISAPLDIFLVRKIGVPWQPELALGAIATGGVQVLNREVLQSARLSADAVERATAQARGELARREAALRGAAEGPPRIAGRTVILIDDGLATGSTMRAAVEAVRQQHPARLVVAVPVAAPAVCEQFHPLVDDVVCLATPEPFQAVGLWYEDFSQNTDEEVRNLLARAHHEGPQIPQANNPAA